MRAAGALETTFGLLTYSPGRLPASSRAARPGACCRTPSEQRFLIVEAFGGDIQPPKRYRNEFGQLLEHSPFCERDLRAPDGAAAARRARRV